MNKNILKKYTHDRFTIIDNQLLAEKSLSWKAKGLLCYLLSMRNDWVINQKEIANHAKDGLDAVRSGFKELETAGFMRRELLRASDGKFEKHITAVRESLDIPWDNESTPERENPILDNAIVENPTLTSTNINKNLLEQENLCSSSDEPGGVVSSKTTKQKATRQQMLEAFNRLWDYYPVKKGKQNAYKAFCSAAYGKTSEELELFSKEVWDGVVGLLQEDRWLREIKQHEKFRVFVPELPNGSTWFNQQRWTDQHETDPVKFLENLKARSK